MSYYFYTENKRIINNLLSNFNFDYNIEIETIIDADQDVVEITQYLKLPEDAIVLTEDSFYWH